MEIKDGDLIMFNETIMIAAFQSICGKKDKRVHLFDIKISSYYHVMSDDFDNLVCYKKNFINANRRILMYKDYRPIKSISASNYINKVLRYFYRINYQYDLINKILDWRKIKKLTEEEKNDSIEFVTAMEKIAKHPRIQAGKKYLEWVDEKNRESIQKIIREVQEEEQLNG